ncbi:MAG: uroporphyrinogen-III C-methyltransferase [Proteobacteria bacterium]|nr:uroporphyrinogen-III C-methyltransferase [Pseudomonadota bacterium]
MTAPDTDALLALLRGRPALAPGHVWLAGAGPGDPGWLTLDVLSGLTQADTVVHDALVAPEVLALAPPGAERIFAGKRGGKPSADQADISATLIARAKAGRRVLRLKGGDPLVFGRGGEEAVALVEAGVPFRILPGLTAGLAGLAAAGIPPTMRGINQAVTLVTGHGADGEGSPDWAALARTGEPIVVYMALRKLPSIVAALLAGGMRSSTPAAVVAAATTPAQSVLVSTLDRIATDAAEAHLPTPALVVFGEIVAMRRHLLALTAAVEAC